jgi:predicted DNA binding CopG/RHH family protein
MDKPKKQVGGAVSEVSRANLDPMARQGTGEQTAHLTVRLPKTLLKAMKQQAKLQRLSASEYARQALEDKLAKDKVK